MTNMTARKLGIDGAIVSTLGLGCMAFRMGDDLREQETVRTIQSAIDAGFSFLDTGDFYGSGHSEMLVGRALRGRRDSAFLSVKFGAQVASNGRLIGLDGRPNSVDAVFEAVAKTSRRTLKIPAYTAPRLAVRQNFGYPFKSPRENGLR